MREAPSLGDARDQLTLVLGFFPRVDAKQSAVAGVHLAMLGYLASKWPAVTPTASILGWVGIGAGALFAVANMISLYFLYRGSFPDLDGGEGSLVFFREIAKQRELSFVEEYLSAADAVLTRDVLCQVWRNSVILHTKFRFLRHSYRVLLGSVVPWIVALFALR
ncbi:Pycsar system effector family protein [Luteibacter jiangsuensis]